MNRQKVDMLYEFLEFNAIQPNLPKEQAYLINQCSNCKKSDVFPSVMPLGFCGLSDFDNIDLSWGRINLSNANIFGICVDCLKRIEEERKGFNVFYTLPKSFEFLPQTPENANFFFGVETLASNPIHHGLISEDIFTFSEEETMYQRIKENAEFTAKQLLVENRLLSNKINNIEALHKKELKKKINWTIFFTAIVAGGFMAWFNH
ncbi:hypothetical protein AA0X95_11065 [Bacillus sp. 1P10SD]|uniref:hypothetical protein n=1 Tax=Bacillus sp. 1P10SD TaxID=3132265 RepID=UPI0039A68825